MSTWDHHGLERRSGTVLICIGTVAATQDGKQMWLPITNLMNSVHRRLQSKASELKLETQLPSQPRPQRKKHLHMERHCREELRCKAPWHRCILPGVCVADLLAALWLGMAGLAFKVSEAY